MYFKNQKIDWKRTNFRLHSLTTKERLLSYEYDQQVIERTVGVLPQEIVCPTGINTNTASST